MAEPACKNVRTANYKKMLSYLPERIIRLADLAFEAFCDDPTYPSLNRKELDDDGRGRHRAGSLSVRVNMQYRAIYVVDGETNVWYWIGTHNDYDNFVGHR